LERQKENNNVRQALRPNRQLLVGRPWIDGEVMQRDVSLRCLSYSENKAAVIVAASASGTKLVPTDCDESDPGK
jgi:hypothetical protein